MVAAGAFRVEAPGGRTRIECPAFGRSAGVRHGFSARPWGYGDGDFGGPCAPVGATRTADRGPLVGPEGAGVGLRRTLLEDLGMPDRTLFEVRQVHGASVVDASAAVAPDAGCPEGDALFAPDGRGVALAVRAADCVPVLVADREGPAIAAVHAGWRGTAAGIVGRVVERFAREGVPPSRLTAAVGPAIGACCYEVGEDCAERVLAASGADLEAPAGLVGASGRDGAVRLDLERANRRQLVAAGIPDAEVWVSGACTSCGGRRFHSFRRDGAAAGRMLAVIGGDPAVAGAPAHSP